jgi:hypothetical protein
MRMAETTRVTVCACTYRRPEGLRALLAGGDRRGDRRQ